MYKKGFLYVIVQLICIFILVKWSPFSPLGRHTILQFIAFGLGVWAIYTMKQTKINVLPELKEGASLVRSGPYALIRHPMYTAILLFFLPVLIVNFTILKSLVFVILLVDLLLKLKYEEEILTKAFKDYTAYKKSTYRLLPFIY